MRPRTEFNSAPRSSQAFLQGPVEGWVEKGELGGVGSRLLSSLKTPSFLSHTPYHQQGGGLSLKSEN